MTKMTSRETDRQLVAAAADRQQGALTPVQYRRLIRRILAERKAFLVTNAQRRREARQAAQATGAFTTIPPAN